MTYLICSNNQLTSLDVSQNTALNFLGCVLNQLTSLDVSTNTELGWLSCQNNQLTSLDVSNNTALYNLKCSNNQLTSLDVSQNTALIYLQCHWMYLTSLDVSNNTALLELLCYENQLISLDLSLNTALHWLYCDNNELQCLNVKNGNNTNFYSFNATLNPNLTCIEVDNVAWSDANWTAIDAQMSFSNACSSPCAVGLEELSNTPKQLVKITDLIGRETTSKPNTPLIYIYSDGTAEKVFKMD